MKATNEAVSPASTTNKPAPKMSAARKALIERAQRERAAAEAFHKQQEEEERRYKEELERERQEQLEKEKIRAEQAEKKRLERERLRKEGKLLTKTQQQQKEANDLYLKQLKEQGLLQIPEQSPKELSEESAQHKKVVQGTKKVQKTKAQLEAERILQEKRLQNEKQEQFHQSTIDELRHQKPELVKPYDTYTTEVNQLRKEMTELKTERDVLTEMRTKYENMKKDEEDLDDWEASADEDPEEEKYLSNGTRLLVISDRIEKISSLLPEAESKLHEAALALEEDRTAVEQQMKKAMKEEEAKHIEAAASIAEANSPKERTLRSPIVVILGHVDSGKTSLLDKIRNSNVAKGEAGGITQQIGATFIPIEAVRDMTSKLDEEVREKVTSQLPGLLVIDTPGHESFSKLRSRGSSLCDIAILVVDIQKGLQQQTIESIELLRMRKTPFVVAVTKVDALYQWNTKDVAFNPICKSLENATDTVEFEYYKLMRNAIAEFAVQNLNAVPFYENTDPSRFVSLVPLSSKTGEGIPDLLSLVCDLTQSKMKAKLAANDTKLQCTVLEVTNLQGYGATLDVILVNGSLRDTDTIVCSSLSGPIVTPVRALLTPPPLKEMRNKMDYVTNKIVHSAMGLKISAPNLSTVLPGSSLLVCGPRDNIEDLKDEVQADLQDVLCRLNTDANGVFVHTSSLGSLEALLTFLGENNIPVSGFDIGPVHRVSVSKASVAIEKKHPEYAIVLAFDVKVDQDAIEFADKIDVEIFQSDVIYQLTAKCLKHFERLKEEAKTKIKPVFPVVVEQLGPDFVFHNTDPVVMGVRVINGTLRIGTPLYIPTKQGLQLGRVFSMKKDSKDVTIAHKTDEVSIGLDQKHLEHPPVYGRQFDKDDKQFFSYLTRGSIDALKEFFAEDLTDTDYKLIDKFVELFKI